MSAHYIAAFNAGELSPLLYSRSDVAKYKLACKRLENMMVTPYGSAYRRPGTEYLGNAKNSDRRCRLIGFNYSTTTRFVLEFGHQYMRFWGNGVQVMNPAAPANPLEVATPYDETHLRELQYVQINDVMYVAHASYPVYKLTRVADDSWTFAAVDWKYPPLVDLDLNVQELQLSNPTLGSLRYLNSKVPFFTSADVGTYFALKFRKESSSMYVEQPITSNVYSWGEVSLMDNEEYDFTTTGTWSATVTIWKSTQEETNKGLVYKPVTRSGTTATVSYANHGYTTGEVFQFNTNSYAQPFTVNSAAITVVDANTFTFQCPNTGATSDQGLYIFCLSRMDMVRTYDANSDRNITSTGTSDGAAFYKLQISGYSSGTNGRAVFEGRGTYDEGIFRVDGVYNSKETHGTVIKPCGTWQSPKWSVAAKQSAFNGKYGYARTVCVYEQRLCFAGTSGKPQMVWCSQTDDFENFQLGSNDSDAIQLSIAASQGNRIQWMFSEEKLMLGTSGDEWTIGPSSSSDAFTGSSVQAKRHTSYGSRYIRAILINDVLLFVQRQGRKVRELTYNSSVEDWVAPDLTVLAEHITKPQLDEIAYVQQPDAVLWGVRSDGVLVSMTYERDQNVVGWARHLLGGDVESVATVYGLGQQDDEVWLVVKRTINGSTKRYVERFRADWRAAHDDDNAPDYWYLDCGKRYSGAAATEITGLGHLEGKTVGVFANGVPNGTAVVSGGKITLASAATKVLVGLPYESYISPMDLELDLKDGTSHGRNKKVHRVVASLYKSSGVEASAENGVWEKFEPRGNDSTPVYTGEQQIVLAGSYGFSTSVQLRSVLPLPFTLRALTLKGDVYGL